MIRRSWLWLTWKYWAAQRLARPLRLEPGRYVADGRRLSKIDDGPEEGRQAKASNDSDDGDSGTRTQYAQRADLHRPGDGDHERLGQRNDGLRELQEPDSPRHE